MRLSKIMDIGTSVMKTSIVSRVSKIKDEDLAYTKYILQKAKIDDDYLVRQLAEQEEKRLCD